EAIGFKHWIFVIAVVGVIYAGVVYLHSEERARELLKELTALGPRPSGSDALERPSGCFDLKFLSSFTLCYYKITNIVVRIGPASGPTNQALMLNCHYDTMPDTPGATDDAAGPGNSWLLQTYLETAPHPFCSVLAQEIFQSGIIPSDTDFRIFRDHGRISGLDIAYTKNGWVYHTEFDEEWRIEAGAIQRYKLPEIVAPLYVLPMLIAGCTVHTYFADKTKVLNIEMVQYDSIVISYAAVLFALTSYNVASAFFVFNYVMFPLLKDPLIFVLGSIGVIKRVTPRVLLYTQLVCFTPVFVFATYAISQCVDFFVPVMGRLGNAVNPEFIMAPIGLAIASSFVLFVNNLFYISRRMNYMIKCGCAIFVFFFIALITTRLGVPYEFSEEHPRLRRIIALHTNRTIYDFKGNVVQKDNGLFIQSLDYRGAEDLPVHSFLQGSKPPNCSGIKDEYCRLPYYTAIHELFPPEHSLWVPVPSPAPVPYPIKLSLIDRVRVDGNRLNLTFEPAATPSNPKHTNNVEIAVASHHAHGEHQHSETLRQLRHLIQGRRQTPEMAVGWWKWGITMIGGVAELVVHVF
ncbi:hypothetical protein TELCIR_01809, partial [Teladorsagia circumcincta]